MKFFIGSKFNFTFGLILDEINVLNFMSSYDNVVFLVKNG